MDNVDQFFKNSHYKIVRLLLSIVGLWPFHTLRRRCTIYFVMILLLGSGFTCEILGILDIWRDTFELLNSLPVFLFAALAIVKTIYAIYTLPKIKLLLTNMREYHLSPKSDEEAKIHNSHALYARNFGYIYTGVVLGHPFIFQFMTLMAKINYQESEENVTSSNKAQGIQSGISHPVNYMVDVDTYYVPIFIHTAVCEVCYGFLLVTLDVLYITLIEHCCGLLEGLRCRLKNALNFQGNNDLMFTQDKSYSNIVYSIQRHTETMQFIAIMESVFSLPLFVHVGCAIILLSIVGFQIITTTGNIQHLIRHFSYMNAILINIFLKIGKICKIFRYNAQWYNMPIETSKLLIMILMTSKKPLIFTIGKLFSLSYITFNAVLRTSMSYFMLLRSVQ
ncbi:Odorant receptor 292 [Nylanderia fulva]|uniref:Odorant receptor n=1 Tax=Nylanderia fulva TaxID=613905 RepID=A0A6G1LP46_9HYME|nr:Odorant receptor 292 [Nylanderia fulva]